MRVIVLFLCLAASAHAQLLAAWLSAGLKGGVPVTDAVCCGNSDSIIDTGRWTLGPTLELRLIYGFSLECDALYRGYRTQTSYASPTQTTGATTYPPFFSTFSSNTKVWDVPLLLKYRIGSGPFRPFVDAGYTWSHSTSDSVSSLVCLGAADACAASGLNPYFHAQTNYRSSGVASGPTGGIGVEFRRAHVTIAPEVRYTHFSNPTLSQLTILAGFTF